jgi:nitrite reductase (NADH) small subunit
MLHSIGALREIPEGEGRNVDVAGRRIAIFRARGGQVFATQAQCPHRGGPLADGILGGGRLMCPLHEWRFDLQTGETENGNCPIEVYATRVEADGTIAVELP